MKKWIIALVLLISCSGILPVNAAKWCFVGKTPSGYSWYIDEESIVRRYDRAAVWLKWELEDEYWLLQREVTKDRTIKLLQYIVLNSNGEIVYWHVGAPGEYETYAIQPNTIFENIYNAIW